MKLFDKKPYRGVDNKNNPHQSSRKYPNWGYVVFSGGTALRNNHATKPEDRYVHMGAFIKHQVEQNQKNKTELPITRVVNRKQKRAPKPDRVKCKVYAVNIATEIIRLRANLNTGDKRIAPGVRKRLTPARIKRLSRLVAYAKRAA